MKQCNNDLQLQMLSLIKSKNGSLIQCNTLVLITSQFKYMREKFELIDLYKQFELFEACTMETSCGKRAT